MIEYLALSKDLQLAWGKFKKNLGGGKFFFEIHVFLHFYILQEQHKILQLTCYYITLTTPALHSRK